MRTEINIQKKNQNNSILLFEVCKKTLTIKRHGIKINQAQETNKSDEN